MLDGGGKFQAEHLLASFTNKNPSSSDEEEGGEGVQVPTGKPAMVLIGG